MFGISFLAGSHAQSQSTLGQQFTARPFIAQKRVVYTPRTRRDPVIRLETFARRSDGSYLRSFQVASPAGEQGWMVEIYDLHKGTDVTLEPFTKSVITCYRSQDEMRKWLRTQPSCEKAGLANEASLRAAGSRDTLLGREVVEIRDQTDSEIEDQQWVDPELDCYPLQRTLVSPSGASQEHTVTAVKEQEPPDSLFEAPQDYAERSPWQVEMIYQTKYPGHELWGNERAKVIDERYSKNRRNP